MAFISKMTRGQTERCCKIFKMLLPSLNSCSFSFLENQYNIKDKKRYHVRESGGNHSDPTGVSAPGLQGESVHTMVI